MAHKITERCIGCTICAKSCPVRAITGTLKERHEINARRCVDCGVCGRVCPSGAVLDAAGQPVAKVERARWKHPRIDAGLCSACSLCVDICRFDCLAISPPKERGDLHVFSQLIEEKRCVGCGLCANICPLHAITMTEGTP